MSAASGPRPSDKLIPWYIVLFFVVQTVLFAWFIWLSETTHTGVTTEQAYEKGLDYNGVISKAQEQAALGFTSSIEQSGGEILFILKDAAGKPVAGAKVTLWFFRPVQDGMDSRFDMTERQNGIYALTEAPQEKGLWEVRVRAQTAKGPYQTSKRMVFQ